MKIAQVTPLYEAVPPKLYGGTERVVAHLTDALVDLGHDLLDQRERLVTLGVDQADAGATVEHVVGGEGALGADSELDLGTRRALRRRICHALPARRLVVHEHERRGCAGGCVDAPRPQSQIDGILRHPSVGGELSAEHRHEPGGGDAHQVAP